MNINEIPHHLFFYKGTKVTEFGQQFRFGDGSTKVNDGINYILSLLDITSKPTRIGIREILEFQEQVKSLNPIEHQEFTIPDSSFIDAMTDLSFRLKCAHVAVMFNGPLKNSKTKEPVKAKMLHINFAKLSIMYYKAFNQWVKVEDLEAMLRKRGNDIDKMSKAINSKLAPVECAALKEKVTIKADAFNLTRMTKKEEIYIPLEQKENEFSKFLF